MCDDSHQFEQELKDKAPGWTVRIRRTNLLDQDSCMARPRTFIIGLHPAMIQTTQQEELLATPYLCVKTLNIMHYLEHKRSDEDFDNLTVKQQSNVLHYIEIYAKELKEGSDEGKASMVCTFDCARDPNLAFGSALSFDQLATLRTNHATVWVLPSPPWADILGPRGRKVSLRENCFMMGVCPNTVHQMSDNAVEVALGNAIAVPSMTTVLFPIIGAWQLFKRNEAAQSFFNSSSEPEPSSDEDGEEGDQQDTQQ